MNVTASALQSLGPIAPRDAVDHHLAVLLIKTHGRLASQQRLKPALASLSAGRVGTTISIAATIAGISSAGTSPTNWKCEARLSRENLPFEFFPQQAVADNSRNRTCGWRVNQSFRCFDQILVALEVNSR